MKFIIIKNSLFFLNFIAIVDSFQTTLANKKANQTFLNQPLFNFINKLKKYSELFKHYYLMALIVSTSKKDYLLQRKTLETVEL